jgi:hypothetical protein
MTVVMRMAATMEAPLDREMRRFGGGACRNRRSRCHSHRSQTQTPDHHRRTRRQMGSHTRSRTRSLLEETNARARIAAAKGLLAIACLAGAAAGVAMEVVSAATAKVQGMKLVQGQWKE